MRSLARSTAILTLALIGALTLSSASLAQSTLTGPSVVPDRYEASPGDMLMLDIAGFSARSVTISVCGNEARRGSSDCDMPGSLARETPGGSRTTDFRVTAPPAPCPCIIRVSSNDNLEVAVAPLVVIGHPVADVVGSTPTAVQLGVAITANPAAADLGTTLQSSLGGPTAYDVTVRVTNRATFQVTDIALASTFTRTRFDDVENIAMPDPGTLAPGESWVETVQVEVPSLTFGDVEWSATASGQGPSVTATDTTSSQPLLLYVLGAVLVVDLLILIWRLVVRIRRRRREMPADPTDNPFIDDPAPTDPGPNADGSEPEVGPVPSRERQLVG